MNCKHCKSKLISIHLSGGERIVCNNYRCFLYREKQAAKVDTRRKRRARENYAYAKSLGLSVKDARRLRNCSRERIDKEAT